MISQHPDNANKPYWHTTEFVSTKEETHECYISFSDLGVSEYKWDWEGKFVDESVIERLFGKHFEYFKKFPLGKEKFLTFRLPNPKAETEFRMGRAFMGILGAASLAKKVGMHGPPLFEVILPMTETAEEMIAIQEAFSEMALLKHDLYNLKDNVLKHIGLIPLFEQVDIIMSSDMILEEYIDLHKKTFGFEPVYIRPYLARSDPALNAGLIPTILAIKVALSRYKKFAKKTGIKLFPIIGSASLPFRGGLSPETVSSFCEEYRGIRTALIQSAFRYDYETKKVKRAIKKIGELLPHGQAATISEKEEQDIRALIPTFGLFYRQVVEEIAPIVNEVASQLPKRRERVLHIGLFGYSRGLGKVKLPRAIGFTGALYSLGIPPEFIGTGRSIRYAVKTGKIKLLEKYYLGLKTDLLRAGRFLYKDGLSKLAQKSEAWRQVLTDVEAVEEYVGKKLGPKTKDEKEHCKLVAAVHKKISAKQPITKHLIKLAKLRKSVG
jgi:phosphoenolpyruvate carboxylase